MGAKLLNILVRCGNLFLVLWLGVCCFTTGHLYIILNTYHYGRDPAAIAQFPPNVGGIGAALAKENQTVLFSKGGIALTVGGGCGPDPVPEEGTGAELLAAGGEGGLELVHEGGAHHHLGGEFSGADTGGRSDPGAGGL